MKEHSEESKENQLHDDIPAPPVFKNWRGWYIVVLGFLVLQIVVYYFITKILG